MGTLDGAFGKKPTEDAKGELTAEERLFILIGRTIEVMKEHAPKEPYHVAFDIPESQNEGHLFFKLLRPGDWQLQIGANRAGTKMLVSYFLCHGDKETVLAYLSKDGLREELMRDIKELSASVDDKF